MEELSKIELKLNVSRVHQRLYRLKIIAGTNEVFNRLVEAGSISEAETIGLAILNDVVEKVFGGITNEKSKSN